MKSQTTAKQYLEERYEAGRRCFDDLSQEEREIATGHLNLNPEMDANELLTETQHALEFGAMLAFAMKNQREEDFQKVLSAIRKDASEYNKESIDALFEQILEEENFDAQYNKPYIKDEAYYNSVHATA